ncbi:MAG: hypothetical protein ACF8PN_02335 [Phycisphaerales bacterium]
MTFSARNLTNLADRCLDPEAESEILAYLDLQIEYLDWFITRRFEREASASPRPSASDEVASYVASVAGQMERVVDSARSHRAIARLALDLRDYRAEHGVYPDPSTYEAPIDPWTGRPISYRIDGAGFILFSPAPIGGEPIEWRWN